MPKSDPNAAAGAYPALRVLSVSNQKGGVGKTTTAINLGTALAAVGERVLILDLDPQGNASTGLGVSRSQRSTTAYDVLVGGQPLAQAAVATSLPGLFIVPSDPDLSGVEPTAARTACATPWPTCAPTRVATASPMC